MKYKSKINNNFGERGAALITSLFALLLVTLLGFALMTTGLTASNVSNNDRQQTEAFYISEAGLTHATNLVKSAGSSQYTNILRAGDLTAGTGDELSTQPAGSTPIPQAGLAFGRGRYRVRVSDDAADTDGNDNALELATDTNGRIVITSTGIGRDGATATTEVTVTSGASYGGFLADGEVIVSNSSTVTGPAGTIQVNGNLNISGGLCAEQMFSIVGTINNVGNTTSGASCTTTGVLGSTVLVSQPRILPPIIDVAKLRSDFRSSADFIFTNSGTIFRQTNGVVDAFALTATQISTLGLSGWTWGNSSQTWSYSASGDFTNGIYYFENSNMKISNAGSQVTPPQLTFLSEGSIEITNGQTFVPKMPGYALVSANDIKITSTIGNVGNPALVYAYGQLEFTNQSDLLGSLVVANFCQPDGTNGPDVSSFGGQNLVSRASKGTVRFSNRVDIITANLNLGSGLNVISWREVRY